MPEIKRILIPLDGSKYAEITLPFGLELAGLLEGKLDLVSVDEAVSDQTGLNWEKYLGDLDLRLRGQFPDLAKSGIWHSQVLKGKVADEIVQFAQKRDSDLVILSAHGSSGRGALQIGKIANRILSGVDKPVLLIKSPPPEGKPLIKRILMPLDGSGFGQAGIELVRVLAPVLGAEVVLIHAMEPLPYLPNVDGMAGNTLPANDEDIQTAASGFLEKQSEYLQAAGIRTSVVIESGPAAAVLLDYAAANQVDLIAIATHGLSGFQRWAFGSVAQKVILYGTVSLLVVGPTDAGSTTHG